MSVDTAVKITGKSIAEFWARIETGTVLECTENTCLPERVGQRWTVTRPGKTSIIATMPEGGRARLNPPTRASDVIALTDDSITYKIEHREGHTATWKLVSA